MAVGAFLFVLTYFIPNDPLPVFNAVAVAGWGMGIAGALLSAYVFFRDKRKQDLK
jgi:hypothetical protein